MNPTTKLESALKAYGDQFDNLDELIHPAYMEDPKFIDFLLAAAKAQKPATQKEIEAALGQVPWNW